MAKSLGMAPASRGVPSTATDLHDVTGVPLRIATETEIEIETATETDEALLPRPIVMCQIGHPVADARGVWSA